MAAPRLFVSSTYYDLKHVRADLKEFGRTSGFEVVLFERGDIPYLGKLSLEEACYREIEKCDIVVSLVGGRYGTRSKTDDDASISHVEVKTSIELGRQMFFFIEASVLAEYRIFDRNRERANEIQWNSVDSVAVFKFIDFIYGLERNNAVFPFGTSQEIIADLRGQILGLFQDLLQRTTAGRHESYVGSLLEATKDLKVVLQYLKEKENASADALREVLFTRHPLFGKLKDILKVNFRIFFENVSEMGELMKMLKFTRVPDQELGVSDAESFFWTRKIDNKREYVGVVKELFDDSGNLKPKSREQWRDEFLTTSLVSSK